MRGFLSLHPDQKKAVILLQLGTFLEYFDLMLYVHMAVLLNELFFPKTDPATTSLLAAFAFCSTYILRPLAALIFGYMGDHIGRKTTVILTMMMMSTSCLIMATLPPYAQIGITASWMVIICRVLQGFSSMGEIIGASIYLTEITESPMRYVLVSLVTIFSSLGGLLALVVASMVLTFGFDWRKAFWIGMVIALVGTAARTRLRETPDFVDAKRRLDRGIEEAQENDLKKRTAFLKRGLYIQKQKNNKKVAITYFLMDCSWPLWFYLIYIYCGNFLTAQMGCSAEQVIHQNLIVSVFQLLGFSVVSFISYRIHPLKILHMKQCVILPLILLFPIVLFMSNSSDVIFVFQCVCAFCCFTTTPSYPVICLHFPVFKRFTYSSFIYALTRAFVYIIASFGLPYLTKIIGHWSILIIALPLFISFEWGIRYFKKLEAAKSDEDLPKRPIPLKDYEKLTAANS